MSPQHCLFKIDCWKYLDFTLEGGWYSIHNGPVIPIMRKLKDMG